MLHLYKPVICILRGQSTSSHIGIHVFLGLPLGLFLTTSNLVHLFSQSSSSFLSHVQTISIYFSCIHHWLVPPWPKLWVLHWEARLSVTHHTSTWSFSGGCVVSSLDSCSTSRGHASLPYVMQLLTQLSYTFHFTCRETLFAVKKGASSNFKQIFITNPKHLKTVCIPTFGVTILSTQWLHPVKNCKFKLFNTHFLLN
jgi:hypothetical protein